MSQKVTSSSSAGERESLGQSTISTPQAGHEENHPVTLRILDWLENIDTFNHIIVAAFLLIVALGVLVYTAYSFGSNILMVINSPLESAGHVNPPPESAGHIKTFIEASLGFLSDVLFVVIILEVLRTILNYLQSRTISLEPFLIIGIISGIRKILLVSATTSLVSNIQVNEFNHSVVEESISVVSIVLLAISMVLLRRYSQQKQARLSSAEPQE